MPAYDNENPYSFNNIGTPDEDIANAIIQEDLVGVFGMPFQFLGSVDPRLNSSNFDRMSNDNTKVGALYAEKIVARMPLLFLIPCKQKFMESFDSHDKNIILNALVSGEGDSSLFGSLDKVGRYYTTEFDVVS